MMKTTLRDFISNRSAGLLHWGSSSITQKLSHASCGSVTTTHPSQSCWLPLLDRVARAPGLLTNPSAENYSNHSRWKWNPSPRQSPLTCFQGLTPSGCASRSTSWGELSSCPCGWRAKAAPSAQQRRSPGAEIRGEASPSRSLTRGSLSSHRGLLLSCISLWKREKEMENNK